MSVGEGAKRVRKRIAQHLHVVVPLPPVSERIVNRDMTDSSSGPPRLSDRLIDQLVDLKADGQSVRASRGTDS